MLEVECDKCKRRFMVEGYTTPDSWEEPGETVTELKCDEELCECLKAGGSFDVVSESYEPFEDDMI